MSKSKIYHEVETYLKTRGTPDTPKRIAEVLGKKPGDSNVAAALRELTAEGKLIRTKKRIRDKPVWYEWNASHSDGITPGKVNPKPEPKPKSAYSDFFQRPYSEDELSYGVLPNPPSKPEVSELRELLENYHTGGTATPLLEAILTAIEDLQKPEPTTDGSEKVYVYRMDDGNIFISTSPKMNFADKPADPIASTTIMPWIEGQFQ